MVIPTGVRFCQYNDDKRTVMNTWERRAQRKAGEESVKLGGARCQGLLKCKKANVHWEERRKTAFEL